MKFYILILLGFLNISAPIQAERPHFLASLTGKDELFLEEEAKKKSKSLPYSKTVYLNFAYVNAQELEKKINELQSMNNDAIKKTSDAIKRHDDAIEMNLEKRSKKFIEDLLESCKNTENLINTNDSIEMTLDQESKEFIEDLLENWEDTENTNNPIEKRKKSLIKEILVNSNTALNSFLENCKNRENLIKQCLNDTAEVMHSLRIALDKDLGIKEEKGVFENLYEQQQDQNCTCTGNLNAFISDCKASLRNVLLDQSGTQQRKHVAAYEISLKINHALNSTRQIKDELQEIISEIQTKFSSEAIARIEVMARAEIEVEARAEDAANNPRGRAAAKKQKKRNLERGIMYMYIALSCLYYEQTQEPLAYLSSQIIIFLSAKPFFVLICLACPLVQESLPLYLGSLILSLFCGKWALEVISENLSIRAEKRSSI